MLVRGCELTDGRAVTLPIFSIDLPIYILDDLCSTHHLFSTVLLNMQRVSVLGRTVNFSFFGVKALQRRNLFTTEGYKKGNGDPCSPVWERKQEEVMKLKYLNTDDGCQYIEYIVTTVR
jgi:hypothetical protein